MWRRRIGFLLLVLFSLGLFPLYSQDENEELLMECVNRLEITTNALEICENDNGELQILINELTTQRDEAISEIENRDERLRQIGILLDGLESGTQKRVIRSSVVTGVISAITAAFITSLVQ